MLDVHGQDSELAILYARVSGDDQARKGYSVPDQLDAGREWAAREGYDVLEEVLDEGYSGAYLERPGLDRVRDLVEAGGVGVVVVLFRDRLARGVYAQLLKDEFAEQGTRLVALNNQMDDSPEGELQGGILDQFAAYERAKIMERTRRGKLRKAREGKILANNAVDYGFEYNATRDGYLIDEETMSVVRRIFHMVGVEGMSIKSVASALNREGVRPPVAPWSRSGRWGTTAVRDCIISDDVYRPHTHEEISALVTPEVAARLEGSRLYGIWWYNRTRAVSRQVPADGRNGKKYKRRVKYLPRPREEWIAVPVPDSGVPRGWVDAAREEIKENRKTSNAGRRFWELSGGIMRCGGCGRAMVSHTTTPNAKSGMYFYYVCRTKYAKGRGACAGTKHLSAKKLEGRVWAAISDVLKDPEQLRVDLDAMIALEREGVRGDPDEQAKLWAEKLAELDRKRARYQEMAADDLITFGELRARLAEIEKVKETAEQELEAVRGRQGYIDTLERDRDALLDHLEGVAPEALEEMNLEQRHHFYKILRLKVTAYPDGSLELEWAGDGLMICDLDTVSSRRCTRRTRPSTASYSTANGRGWRRWGA